MEFRLLVLRTADMPALARFYSLLGLKFGYHRHGSGPFHYSVTIGQLVLEIYPLTKNQTEADKSLRLGFAVDNFEETMQRLRQNNVILAEPVSTDHGYTAVITDPDGRKIELYKKEI